MNTFNTSAFAINGVTVSSVVWYIILVWVPGNFDGNFHLVRNTCKWAMHLWKDKGPSSSAIGMGHRGQVCLPVLFFLSCGVLLRRTLSTEERNHNIHSSPSVIHRDATRSTCHRNACRAVIHLSIRDQHVSACRLCCRVSVLVNNGGYFAILSEALESIWRKEWDRRWLF